MSRFLRQLAAMTCVALAALAATSTSRAQSVPTPPATAATAVHVVTYLDIAPERLATARPALRRYRATATGEPGNAGVSLYQEIGRPGRLVLREVWVTEQALEQHGKSSSQTDLAVSLKPLQLAPADQRVHVSFAAGPGAAKSGRNTVYVFTHVDVPPTRQAEIEPMLKELQATSVRAAGSIAFDVLQQSSRKNHFTVIEAWTSQKSLDAAAMAPAQHGFRDKLGPMLGALYDQRIYRPLD